MPYTLTVTVAELQVGDIVVPNRFEDWTPGVPWAPTESSYAAGATVTAVNPFPGNTSQDNWTAEFNRRLGSSTKVTWATTWKISVQREGDDPGPPGDNLEWIYLDGTAGNLQPDDSYRAAGYARDVQQSQPLTYTVNYIDESTGSTGQDQAPAARQMNIRRPNPEYVPPASLIEEAPDA